MHTIPLLMSLVYLLWILRGSNLNLRLRSPLRACGALLRTPLDDGLDAEELYNEGLQIGFDGSIVFDHDFVYILGIGVKELDYFTAFSRRYNEPIAMLSDDSYCLASSMCHVSLGRIAFAVRTVQRKWRSIRASRYEARMLAFGIMLARYWQRTKSWKCNNRSMKMWNKDRPPQSGTRHGSAKPQSKLSFVSHQESLQKPTGLLHTSQLPITSRNRVSQKPTGILDTTHTFLVEADGFIVGCAKIGDTSRLLVGCRIEKSTLAQHALSLFPLTEKEDLVRTDAVWDEKLNNHVEEMYLKPFWRYPAFQVLAMGSNEKKRKRAGRIAFLILAIWKRCRVKEGIERQLQNVLAAADRAIADKSILLDSNPEQRSAKAVPAVGLSHASAAKTPFGPSPPKRYRLQEGHGKHSQNVLAGTERAFAEETLVVHSLSEHRPATTKTDAGLSNVAAANTPLLPMPPPRPQRANTSVVPQPPPPPVRARSCMSACAVASTTRLGCGKHWCLHHSSYEAAERRCPPRPLPPSQTWQCQKCKPSWTGWYCVWCRGTVR